jgi:hypothetical protein
MHNTAAKVVAAHINLMTIFTMMFLCCVAPVIHRVRQHKVIYQNGEQQ